MKLQVEIDSGKFLKDLTDLQQYVSDKLGREAYEFFRNATPIASGNAKNSTKYNQSGSNKVIEANYSYAGVLDKGRHMTHRGMRGSTQAPKGMSEPTQEFIQQQLARQVRKL